MPRQIIFGIDIRDLKIAKTGQKTTLEELCKEFKELEGPEFSFRFFESAVAGYTGKNKILIAWGHFNLHFWKQVILPYKAWRNRCDIIFCVDYFVPYVHFGYKTVQIFHDAFFFEYPQHYNKLWLYLFKALAIPAARKSSIIVVPTNYALDKIHQHTHFPKQKLVTVYEGPKSLTVAPVTKDKPNWFDKIEGKNYLLHVGVIEKRKNLPMLIRSFKKLVDAGYEDYKLVLVGEGSGKLNSDDTFEVHQTIRECQLGNHVILLGYLPDEELSLVYSNAIMYVFPSYNEGFGIPILEAFKFNLPALVADSSSLPEVGADAVLTFNPHDANDMYLKIKLIVDSDTLRAELIAKGKKRLEYFSWKKAANQLTGIFKQALLT